MLSHYIALNVFKAKLQEKDGSGRRNTILQLKKKICFSVLGEKDVKIFLIVPSVS